MLLFRDYVTLKVQRKGHPCLSRLLSIDGHFLPQKFPTRPIPAIEPFEKRCRLVAGVKGEHVGVGPRGPYVSSGAKGIYFRENLGKTGSDEEPVTDNSGNLVIGILIAFIIAFAVVVAIVKVLG